MPQLSFSALPRAAISRASEVGIAIALVELADLDAHAGMALRRQAIAIADRPALRFVGGEQAGTGEALERRGELPAEIDGVADAGVHAVAAGRDVLMRGVAGQEDAAALVALGQQQVREPGIGDQDLALEGRPAQASSTRVGIEVGHVDAGRRARLQGPGVLVVLRDQGCRARSGSARRCRRPAGCRGRRSGNGSCSDGRRRRGLPGRCRACRARCSSRRRSRRGNRSAPSRWRRSPDAQGRGHAVGVLLEILEGHAPARVDQRIVQDGARSTGSIMTWLTRMAGSRGWVPSLLARISARFSTTLG